MKLKNVLVTGGTGFLGTSLIKKLTGLEDVLSIKTLSRDENKIQKLQQSVKSSKLETIVGDIRNNKILKYALKNIDTVIHLAAMKHIDLCETDSSEAIDINVNGTKKILDSFRGETFIAISSDKAVRPEGCYGATKLLVEKLVLEEGRKKDKRYMVIRPGNIFGSSGSVLDKWKQEIKDFNQISITETHMTRFFIEVDDLVDFIIQILNHGKNGKIYIPNHKSFGLGDLAKATLNLIGYGDTKLIELGLRKGEKMHESLFDANEKDIECYCPFDYSEFAPKLGTDEIRKLLVKLYNTI